MKGKKKHCIFKPQEVKKRLFLSVARAGEKPEKNREGRGLSWKR